MVGMKIGIEIHQRLATKKLFCNCPSLYEEGGKKPDGKIKRGLYVVYSEVGEIDKAALLEAMKEMMFEYQCFNDSSCLVEMDEEPPHSINGDALDVAIEMAIRMGMEIFDEVQVMRKIVIDGSNTAGFQRTALVAIDGGVETSKGKVGIETLCLEEESAGIVRENVFRLDRLGIPLIEIATAPEIKDPEHAKEVAEKLGLMLRTTGKVMRGIGTIRQDLNVSIEGGARVEIKGAQELNMLPTWIRNEAERQKKLIEIIKKLKEKNAFAKLKFEPKDVTDGIRVNGGFIKSAVEKGERVFGIKLPAHKGILGIELGENRRYGSELSDYAKKAGVKGILHSDEELEKYGIENVDEIAKSLECGNEDAFAIVVAEGQRAKSALNYVFERAGMNFIPGETRKALPNGTTAYMRPLPGKARMYPETDIPPIRIAKRKIEEVKAKMGKGLEEKKAWLERVVSKDLAEKMVRSKYYGMFERVVGKGVDAKVAASIIEDKWRALRREGLKIDEGMVEKALRMYGEKKLAKNGIEEALRMMAKGKSENEVLEKLERIGGKELEKIVREENGDLKKIMQKYGTRVEAEEVMAVIIKSKN
ncbi:MAG: Glu-tRNA(Gln) amidotransferase subunit GatE [Candidatus Micrarchaeia archaeon]